ncbi:YdcF family protein [Mesobacillus subterraneus]|uniref:YdcF family protein n=1 Tax=Mesobacillus subterraneus TaxID=285983 RepID=UPI001CFF409B|nr:YdcF family protein [Mesobacillus subterraneus]WLR56954.1 YdcF family protein [Mesobacillus subterraneus]
MLKKPIIIKIMIAGLLISMFYAGYLHYKITQHANMDVPKNADYILILGARVKGKVPSLALQYRIDHAANYLKENPNTIAIASGGRGPGEDISEAECIKRELIQHGIEESRVLLEDKSTDTYENIGFSKKMIPDNAEVGLVVTNDFHIFRAKMIADNEGLEINGLPAKTPIQAVLKSYTREYLALTKYFMMEVLRQEESRNENEVNK